MKLRKFLKQNYVWVTRDNKQSYDDEIMIWISKHPPRIDPKTGLFSRRQFRDNGGPDYEFTVIHVHTFELLFERTLEPGQIIKAKLAIREIN